MEALRSLTRRVWGPSPTPRPSPTPPRPFWLLPVGEGRPRGVLAASLGELREEARQALALPLPPSLALAQDGTLVESQEFFGTLPPNTPLQVLGEGQRWEPPEGPSPLWDFLGGPGGAPPELPRLGPERLLRELLRVLAWLSRALGQALLGLAGTLRPLLEGPQTQPGPRDHAHLG